MFVFLRKRVDGKDEGCGLGGWLVGWVGWILLVMYLGNNFVSDGHVCNTFCPVLLKLLDI